MVWNQERSSTGQAARQEKHNWLCFQILYFPGVRLSPQGFGIKREILPEPTPGSSLRKCGCMTECNHATWPGVKRVKKNPSGKTEFTTLPSPHYTSCSRPGKHFWLRFAPERFLHPNQAKRIRWEMLQFEQDYLMFKIYIIYIYCHIIDIIWSICRILYCLWYINILTYIDWHWICLGDLWVQFMFLGRPRKKRSRPRPLHHLSMPFLQPPPAVQSTSATLLQWHWS